MTTPSEVASLGPTPMIVLRRLRTVVGRRLRQIDRGHLERDVVVRDVVREQPRHGRADGSGGSNRPGARARRAAGTGTAGPGAAAMGSSTITERARPTGDVGASTSSERASVV